MVGMYHLNNAGSSKEATTSPAGRRFGACLCGSDELHRSDDPSTICLSHVVDEVPLDEAVRLVMWLKDMLRRQWVVFPVM